MSSFHQHSQELTAEQRRALMDQWSSIVEFPTASVHESPNHVEEGVRRRGLATSDGQSFGFARVSLLVVTVRFGISSKDALSF